MDDHHLAVRGLLDVELDEVGALLDARRKAASVFSGAAADAPRCAMTRTGWLRPRRTQVDEPTPTAANATSAATPPQPPGRAGRAAGRAVAGAQAGDSGSGDARGSPSLR